eukprot:CAMPEP_0115874400 /NCGR_PEP_ID=MMETSP0287-20121206/24521_1 /TAXON_ID=412157 /ORGANISM="Chrysochromulina rotalis, Strain UIO044" /LENGTH=570 /DNA_ID=CAMNT_0003329549 /DNA_START=6 /DNA_END=1718 /DNA_ORIENTATION=+
MTARPVVVKIGDARYDLSSFEHPGGQLALFGLANSPDPVGLLYQYHEFSAERLSKILAPYCISAVPASIEELRAVRQPYERVTEIRGRIKKELHTHLHTMRSWEMLFCKAMRLIGWPAFIAFAFATAYGDTSVRGAAVLLYALYVHVVLVWNLHGQSHIVSLGSDDHLSYCMSCIPFAPHSLAWFVQHTVLHHSYTGVALNSGDSKAKEHISFDPDVRFSGVLRLSPDEEWLPHHRFQPLYAPLALGLTVWALVIDMVLLTTKRQFQLYEQLPVALAGREARCLTALLVGSALAVAGAVLVIGMPFGCFAFAMTLCSFSVGYINIPTHTNLLTSHAPVDADYFAAQLAESTSYGGVFSNLMTAGLSKQVEHHLFPNAPFSSLPRMTPIVQAYAKEQGIEYRSFSGFGPCVISWYRQVCRLAMPPVAKPMSQSLVGANPLDVAPMKSLSDYQAADEFGSKLKAIEALIVSVRGPGAPRIVAELAVTFVERRSDLCRGAMLHRLAGSRLVAFMRAHPNRWIPLPASKKKSMFDVSCQPPPLGGGDNQHACYRSFPAAFGSAVCFPRDCVVTV